MLSQFMTSTNGNDSVSGSINPIQNYQKAPYDKVLCLACNRLIGRNGASHLKMHGMTTQSYRQKFPDAQMLSQKEIEGMSHRKGMSEEARKAASDRIKGDKNPAYQHGGRLSPMSKNYIHGYDEEWNKKFAEEQSIRMKEGGWLPNHLKYWMDIGYTNEEAIKLVSESQARGRQYYIRLGMTIEEADRIISERNERWYKTCLENFGARTPLECDAFVQKMMDTSGFEKYDESEQSHIRLYYNMCWKYTNRAAVDIEGIEGRSNELHIDHIYSIKQGYMDGVDPEIIGHITNLRMLSGSKNSAKKSRCDKTLKQLYEDYDNATKSTSQQEVC